MIDCHIIKDLIFIYVSGEASPQTEKLVESHLLTCPECAKALENARLADTMLNDWETLKEEPESGQRFIGRLQRTFFIGSTLILMFFTVALSAWHRVVLLEIMNTQSIYLQLPIQLELRTTPMQIWLTFALILLVGGWSLFQYYYPRAVPTWLHQAKLGLYALLSLFAFNLTGTGEMPGVLFGSLLLLCFFVMALRWRMHQPPSSQSVELARSALTGVPFLGLVLATLNTIISGEFPGVFIAPILLIVGFVYTYRHLSKLPYLISITLISLLLANGLLAYRAVKAVITMVEAL